MKKQLFLIIALFAVFATATMVTSTSFKGAKKVNHHHKSKQVCTYGFTFVDPNNGGTVQLSGEGITSGSIRQFVSFTPSGGTTIYAGTASGTFSGTECAGSGTAELTNVHYTPDGLSEQSFNGSASYIGE